MTRKIIEYDSVTVKRDADIILHDITFDIVEGQFAYLTGRVGAGKSTLLKTIYAQLPVASGNARVLGYDLTSMRRRDIPMLRRQLGVIFQDFQLLNDRNIFDNLKFVLRATGWRSREDIDTRIEWALTQVGMTSRAYEMPYRLSGGEQQRIAIARALLNHPRIILADEPTGNLDHDTAMDIMHQLRSIADSGTAVLMATHNRAIIDAFPALELRCEATIVKKIVAKA